MSRAWLIVPVLMLLPASAPEVHAQLLGRSLTEWRGDLDSATPSVRRSAAFALGKMGLEAERAIPELVKHLEDDSPAVRAQSAEALGEIVLALDRAGAGYWRMAGPALMKLLADPSADVRRGAALGLSGFGPAARDARDDLRKALKDPEAMVRQNAAWALGRLRGEAGEDAVEELCLLLTDESPLVRRDAVQALGEIGLPTARVAMGPILRMVVSEAERRDGADPVVLKTALEKLINLVDPQRPAQAASLRPLLDHADPEVKRLTAFVLANMGVDAARPAVRVLREALADPDPRIQELAAASLAQLFSVARKSIDESKGRGVEVVMSSLVPDARPAALDLADALDASRTPTTRRNAAVALGHIGSDASAAIPRLVAGLKESEPLQVRQYTAEALALIGYPANKAALPEMVKVLARPDDDARVRHRCIWAFFNVPGSELAEHGADRVMERVLEEKEDSTLILRYDCARVLAAALGAQAPDKAVDVLLHMLRNRKLFVFEGTGASVSDVGTEQGGGKSNVQDNLGGDGRFMAAQALGWMGRKVRDRMEVVDALTEASKDTSKQLSQHAAEALREIRR